MLKFHSEQGEISVSSAVFSNITGMAATNCFGVKGMVGKAKETGLYQLLRRESMSRGVSVAFNDDNTVSITLHIAVDQGVNLAVIGSSIIKEVSYKVSQATGVTVKSVDVFIDSMLIG